MKKSFSIIFLIILSFSIISKVFAATITTSTQSEFQAGTVPGTLDANISAGDLRLKANVNTLTESSANDFNAGTTGSGTKVTNASGGEVTLNDTLADIDQTDFVFSYLVDNANNLLYLSTSAGLKVIDTKGTVILDDDVLISTYNESSTPPIANNNVQSIFFDTSRDLMYVTTGDFLTAEGGLSVIDTQGTVSMSDDVLVTTYDSNSSPALVNDVVQYAYLDTTTNLLYIGNIGQGGLSVIDTQGTVSPNDDALVVRYNTSSSPALAGDSINFFYLNKTNNLLYISTQTYLSDPGGVTVINTQGTENPADDTSVTTYNMLSTPALSADDPKRIWIDSDFVYIVTNTLISGTQGLSVIDTHGTLSAADDTLIVTYNSTDTPTLITNNLYDAYLNSNTGLLYISEEAGITIIDTQNTPSVGDDTVVTSFDNGATPVFPDFVFNPFFDVTHNLMYFSSGGIGRILLDGYLSPGSFVSQSINVPSQSDVNFSWSASTPVDTSMSLQSRVGDLTQTIDNFDNSSVFTNVGDYYSYGVFNTTNESSGTLTLSDPDDLGGGSVSAYNWFDAGQTYPAGTVIKARIRTNSDANGVITSLFSEQETGATTTTVNDWTVITATAEDSFQYIGLSVVADDSWNFGTDSVEIDWISIEETDWSGWSTECVTSGNCGITAETLVGKESLQYKLNLSSSDSNVTPVVESVSISSGYQSSGEYLSPVFDSGMQETAWESLTSDSTVPLLTALTFSTRTGNTAVPDGSWSGWSIVTGSVIASPPGQYLQYKTLFSSTDEDVSPILRSVTLINNGASTTINNPISFVSQILEKIFSPQLPPIPYLSKQDSPSLFVTPAFDSNTNDQKVVTFIQEKTFVFDAYLYSAITKASIFKDKIKNLSADRGNVKFIGGEQPLIGFTYKSKTYWQVGAIHELWYKTVKSSENIDPAIIIPELQKYPSIISLSYQSKDLVPPGSPKTLFDDKSLALAHSLDGYHWKVLESSVVDQQQKTVSAISQVGGFYMIVARTSSRTSTNTQ